jgi:ATP-dependent Zn protease
MNAVFQSGKLTDQAILLIYPIIISAITGLITHFFDNIVNVISHIFGYVRNLLFNIIGHNRKTRFTMSLVSYNNSGFPITSMKTVSLIWYINMIMKKNGINGNYEIFPLNRLINNPISSNNIDTDNLQVLLTSIIETRSDNVQVIKTSYEPLYLENDIYMSSSLEKINRVDSRAIYEINITLLSQNKTFEEIDTFVNKIDEKRKLNIIDNHHKYIFIIHNIPDVKDFNQNIRFNTSGIDKSQTFENLFFESKSTIMDDLDMLKDESYYRKFGLKRKIAYLLEGLPGSGKTCITSAIANYTNRHIVHVQISKIKSNGDFEKIMLNRCFDGKEYRNDDIIFMIDEIDYIVDKMKATSLKHTSNGETTEVNISSETITFDVILSFLDGITSQDGLIIIATTNNIDKLPMALFRDGRLKRITTEYPNRTQIINMLEYYFGVKLNEEHKRKVREDKRIQPLTIKNMCIKCVCDKKPIDFTIEEINKITPL